MELEQNQRAGRRREMLFLIEAKPVEKKKEGQRGVKIKGWFKDWRISHFPPLILSPVVSEPLY